jgi:cytochrome c-type biogenesis protein CcmH/NrfG
MLSDIFETDHGTEESLRSLMLYAFAIAQEGDAAKSQRMLEMILRYAEDLGQDELCELVSTFLRRIET